MADITADALDLLRNGFAGVVARPGEAQYDDAVNIWNGAISRRPAVVARCATADDVVRAVACARAEDLEISVRGGGHNYAGFALCDGGLMIDLTPMKTVVVDAERRRATCGGGTTWGELDAATQAHGLAVPGGFVSHTGVAGLTLGGGIGWLSRMAGLSADNLVGAEVVTADGTVRRVSAEVEPELLWALRGGGGNFGVVTEFEFALHPVGPVLQLGLFLFSPEQGGDLLRFTRDYVETLPDDCGVFLAGLSAPPEPFVPEELHFTPAYALLVVGFHGEDEHARLVGPITAALTPTVTLITPIPYVGLQQLFNASVPWGMYGYEKAVYLDELSDGAIETILTHQARRTSPLSLLPIFPMGGAYRTADPDATAFGGRRTCRYVVNISALTMSPDGFDAERAWTRDFWAALVGHAEGIGGYVNFMSEPDEDRVRSSYGPKYDRLCRIKARYDPDNILHLNANIRPALPA
jgi:FAD/FMN-containing dehydrogenase